MNNVMALAEKHGFVWSDGGAFGVVEAFDNQQAEQDVLGMVRKLP